MSSKSISILGCGWLGFPLAKHLVERGFTVKGSTTTSEKLETLKNHHIDATILAASPQLEGERIGDFFQSQVLFLNIPFKRNLKDPSVYKNQIDSVIEHVEQSSIDWVIFASSISVYPKTLAEVSEDNEFSCDSDRSQVLYDVEQSLLSNKSINTTILRFAGLLGYERNFKKIISQEVYHRDAKSPVNLIHIDDCIAIVTKIIEKKLYGEIFNLCCDEHPIREQLYAEYAKQLNIPLGQFDQSAQATKRIIRNEKIKKALDYDFIHSSPLNIFS